MRKLLFILLFILLLIVPTAKAQTCQVASDTFARASLGSNWTATTNGGATLAIVSSTAVAVTASTGSQTGGIVWTGTGTFNPSQYSKITYSTLGNSLVQNLVNPAVEMTTSATTFYAAVAYSNELYLQKFTSKSAETTLNMAAYTVTVGDTVELAASVSGSTVSLTAYVNGASKVTSSDSSSAYTSGTPGIIGYAFTGADTQWQVTPWSGGNLAACVAGPGGFGGKFGMGGKAGFGMLFPTTWKEFALWLARR
jgi:hypothetical protein